MVDVVIGFARASIVCTVLSACQRLEYEQAEDGVPANHTPDESNDEWSEPWSPDLGPEPPVARVCTYEWACECYGGSEASQYCDVVLREESCPLTSECVDVVGDAWDECAVEAFCRWGIGHVEGAAVVCGEPPDECAGTCDEDPSLCDVDGDGVSTFGCGDAGVQCTFGQYCVRLSEAWDCHDEGCSDCESGQPPTWMCVDPPAECDGIVDEGECIRDASCEVRVAWYEGHEVRCARDECFEL